MAGRADWAFRKRAMGAWRIGRVLATRRLWLCFALGFLTGAPFMQGWSAAFLWAGQVSLDQVAIGWVLPGYERLLFIPIGYLLALLLAPLCDRFGPLWIASAGRRRGWLLSALAIAIAVTVLAAAIGFSGLSFHRPETRTGIALRILFVLAGTGVLVCLLAYVIEDGGWLWSGVFGAAMSMGATLAGELAQRYVMFSAGWRDDAQDWLGWVFVFGLILAFLLIWFAAEPRAATRGAAAPMRQLGPLSDSFAPAAMFSSIADPWRAFRRELGNATLPALLGFTLLMAVSWGATYVPSSAIGTGLLGLPAERLQEIEDIVAGYAPWSSQLRRIALVLGMLSGIWLTLRWRPFAAARLVAALSVVCLGWALFLVVSRVEEPVWLWAFFVDIGLFLFGLSIANYFMLLALLSRPPHTAGQTSALAFLALIPWTHSTGAERFIATFGAGAVVTAFALCGIAAILLLRLAETRMRRM